MTDLAPDEMFCPACGVVMHEDANFCPECGAENDAFNGGAPQDPPPADAPGGAPVDAPARAPTGGGTATPAAGGGGGGAGGPAGYDRLIDRSWPLASQEQALAGVKSGVYASILGFSATLFWIVVSAFGLLTGGVPRIDGGVPSGGGGAPDVAATEAANFVLGLIQAAQAPVTILVKFVFWLYYSASFVPIVLDTGSRSIEFDLLSALSPIGISPMAFRVTIAVLLLVFGYRAAASRGYGSYAESAGAGATVALGYLLVLVPGALLVGFSAGGQVGNALSIGPSVAMTVAIGGVFAAVCGSAGGLLREYVRQP